MKKIFLILTLFFNAFSLQLDEISST
ncbi:toluene tolerance protein, partial [Campylobacter jejuni]